MTRPTNPVVDAVALKPCPFCGPGELQTFRLGSIHFVQCVECDIEQTGRTETEAAQAWNTRQSADAALVEAQWQDIETAPKDGTPFWAAKVHPNPKFGVDYFEASWAWAGAAQSLHNRSANRWDTPTHWRPLPAPPTLTRGERT